MDSIMHFTMAQAMGNHQGPSIKINKIIYYNTGVRQSETVTCCRGLCLHHSIVLLYRQTIIIVI